MNTTDGEQYIPASIIIPRQPIGRWGKIHVAIDGQEVLMRPALFRCFCLLLVQRNRNSGWMRADEICMSTAVTHENVYCLRKLIRGIPGLERWPVVETDWWRHRYRAIVSESTEVSIDPDLIQEFGDYELTKRMGLETVH